jgi:hypothetical protein
MIDYSSTRALPAQTFEALGLGIDKPKRGVYPCVQYNKMQFLLFPWESFE